MGRTTPDGEEAARFAAQGWRLMPAGEREIMLGYIHGGTVRAEFMNSVLRLMSSPHQNLIARTSSTGAATLVSYARNYLVSVFLDTGLPWLLMIDSDVTFHPDRVAMLAAAADEAERPIVSGVVAMLDDTHTRAIPSVFTAVRNGDGPATGFTPATALPATDGVARADACGAAFLLVHRTVFEKLPAQQWFAEGITPAGGVRGEDLAFCVRATEAGFPIHVHCGVQPGHMKTICLTPDISAPGAP